MLLQAFALSGQDYIIRYRVYTRTVQVKDLSIYNGEVRYTQVSDGYVVEKPISKLVSITFNTDGIKEVGFVEYGLDTLQCSIDSIVSRSIYYHEVTGESQSIEKGVVFCVQFSKLHDIPDIGVSRAAFLRTQDKVYDEMKKIVRRDSREVDYLKLISLNGDKLEVLLNVRGNEIISYVNCTEVACLILMTMQEQVVGSTNSDFILSPSGRYLPVSLRKVAGQQVEYKTIVYGNPVKLQQKKEEIIGVFFHDYSKPVQVSSTEGIYPLNERNKSQVKAKFDFNLGMGYLLALYPEDASSELKKYIDEMRLGFTLDANLDVHFANNYGLGV